MGLSVLHSPPCSSVEMQNPVKPCSQRPGGSHKAWLQTATQWHLGSRGSEFSPGVHELGKELKQEWVSLGNCCWHSLFLARNSHLPPCRGKGKDVHKGWGLMEGGKLRAGGRGGFRKPELSLYLLLAPVCEAANPSGPRQKPVSGDEDESSAALELLSGWGAMLAVLWQVFPGAEELDGGWEQEQSCRLSVQAGFCT